MSGSREEILLFMKAVAYRPLSFRELARRLGIAKEAREDFKRLMKEMVSDGTLVRIRGGRYGLPARMNLVPGVLLCHPNGFGFVRPDSGGEDVFINPRNMKGAMHKDRVVARVERSKPGGKREGRIIRILHREHSRIVGRFERGRKGIGIVVPSDDRLLQDVVVPPGETGGSGDGEIVEVEITRWPAGGAAPCCKVISVLGDKDDPDVEVEVIVRKYGLSSRFPEDVLGEASGIPETVSAEEIEGRVDLRQRRTVTIDGESAKDFDDGVSIERTKRGFKLFVSIADVSHYVKEGTAIDREAYERGTSIYLPDRCIPMLPVNLSNGICSLNPKVERLAFTAEMDFDMDGRPLKKRFYESVINSRERLTYTEVKRILVDGDRALKERYACIVEDLYVMRELALKLNASRAEEGSIDFDLPEPQIIIDMEGKVEDIVRSERNIAHRIIEEFMLAANRAVAEHMEGLPFLYRVHEHPEEEGLAEFLKFLHNLGLRIRKKKGHEFFKEVLTKVKGRPEEKLVNHLLLRSMKQARYSEENIGHFGLAFDDYTHFTSPIRRYPDLVVHRLLKERVKGRYRKRKRDRWLEALPVIADHTSKMERISMDVEREAADLKKAQFMKERIGEVYKGFISGVTGFGFFVELEEYFVEGLVSISELRDDYYSFAEADLSLVGEHTGKVYKIGNEVVVRIERVDLERRRIDMLLVDDGAAGRGTRKIKRKDLRRRRT